MLRSWRRPRPKPDLYSPEEATKIVVCRICLDTERRMERVCEELDEAYREVIGIEWDFADQLAQHLCWECAARLRAAARLLRRALASHRLLRDMRAKHTSLTLNSIKQIDRSNHYLSSNLSQKLLPPIEYVTKTINNDQLFTTDNYENNMKYTELTLDTIKTIDTIAKRDFADIVNKLLLNNTDITIKEIMCTSPDSNNSDNFIKHGNLESDTIVKGIDRSEQGFNNNLVPYTSDIDENLNVRKDFAVNTDVDDDSSSDRLVIDAGDEEIVETVISSEYVKRADGRMPVDELIDIYNKNGDGDEKLQELNQQFEGVAGLADKGFVSHFLDLKYKNMDDVFGRWGFGGAAADTKGSQATETQIRKRRGRRRSTPQDSKSQLSEADRAEYCLTRASKKLDDTLFTITSVTDEEQIAEVLKRQETYRFKRAPFKCGLCFRGYIARNAHVTHMMRHDESNGAYECVICKIRQKSLRAVKIHMYGQHTVRISCKRCSFVTMNRTVARSHEKWHAGTIYQCPYCLGQFDQESPYKVHLRTQHVHANVCVLCGFTFVSVKGLAVHKCKRHADADKIPLEGPFCEVCEVRFATEAAYSVHFKMSSRHRTNNVPRYIGLREAGY